MMQFDISSDFILALVTILNGALIWLATSSRKHKIKYFSYLTTTVFFIWLFYISYHIYDSTNTVIAEEKILTEYNLKNFKATLEQNKVQTQQITELIRTLVNIDAQVQELTNADRVLFLNYFIFFLSALIYLVINIWLQKRKIDSLTLIAKRKKKK